MKDKNRFEVKNPTQTKLVEERSPEGYQWPAGQYSQGTVGLPWPLPFFFFLSLGYWKKQDTGHVANQIQLFFCLEMLQRQCWQGPQAETSLGSLPAGNEELLPVSTELSQSPSKGDRMGSEVH